MIVLVLNLLSLNWCLSMMDAQLRISKCLELAVSALIGSTV